MSSCASLTTYLSQSAWNLECGAHRKTPLFSWRGFFLPRQTSLVEHLEKKKKDTITEPQDCILLASSYILQGT